jgi:hypothetical protein
MALEEEIGRWSCFARALRKEDREAFVELMDTFRRFALLKLLFSVILG